MRLARPVPARRLINSLELVVRELPALSLLPLGLAIFALFAVVGPVIDVHAGGRLGARVVVGMALFSGGLAVGYGFGTMRRNWWLLAGTVIVHFGWKPIASHLFAAGPPLADAAAAMQLKYDARAVLVLGITSYTFFLWFMNVTASRYLRVRAEMDLAHRIHQVLVPGIERTHGEFEFFGVSQPSGEVGGDLVDVVDTGAGWFAYVADVSGHGVSSGVVMGMFKSAIRMRLRSGGAMGALLADLNTVLLPLKSSAMYVTLACVRPAAGGIEYAVAGHLPILRVRDGQVVEATTPQIPIGMFDDYTFTSAAGDVAPGDLLALITDGLVEVFDAKDRELGLDAVKRVLAKTAGRPLRDIAEALLAAARAHGTQLDDQSILLVRRV